MLEYPPAVMLEYGIASYGFTEDGAAVVAYASAEVVALD